MLVRSLPLIVALAACGSTRMAAAPAWRTGDPTRGDGEQGLAALRSELGVSPAVGHVERGAETWLVHDATGVRIGPLEPSDGQCFPSDRFDVAFEGEPGAVVLFQEVSASVYELDGAKGCMVQIGSFALPDLDFEGVLVLDEKGYTDPMDRFAHVGALVVELTADHFEVKNAASRAIYRLDFSAACTFSASVGSRTDANGVVTLSITRSAQEMLGRASCDDEPEGDVTSERELWLEVRPDGTTQVVYSVDTPPAYSDLSGSKSIVYALPEGALRYDETLRPRNGREGPYFASTWAWSVVPKSGPAALLHTYDSEEAYR